MKKLIFTYIFLHGFLLAYSQQIPMHSQFMFNKFLINPACTGTEENLPVQLAVREQWIGFANAPSSQFISAHQLFDDYSMGLGLSMFLDKFAHERQFGFKLSYSYILPVYDETLLSMGLSFQSSWISYDYREIIALDYDDPSLYMGWQSRFFPQADFGLYLFNEIYNVGFSVNQLIPANVKVRNQDIIMKKLIPHYTLFGSYRFNDIATDLDIESSLLFKTSFKAPSQLDINARLIYEKNYWYGLSLRTSGDIVNMIGLRYKDMSIGFSVDFATNRLFRYQSGTIEAYFTYHIPVKIKIESFPKLW
ncbi:MAG: type IX secretion system membrane protein PorP/SprF [Bacteroidales bacterium]|jgi:type IX secretion system PorP/SprF family membrane protein|nr:type IX secretion system membrane protein PorP/SprF [Bacteroidales bacterium]HOL98254.1 type IX secretion system membrane protein PorP/SprF [Bacteroidales bacterium]HOM36607.1 type IX secretion system membrane protein PorP/SprF [Bacteroidales bacterium]HPD24033.1 type IX secretion system membrane protein PorP/SprF [Bacteroidales bacterium]HRT00016.1 type IX secretion system membrane protein PorP/SprF [Bacteroidales bacterium]